MTQPSAPGPEAAGDVPPRGLYAVGTGGLVLEAIVLLLAVSAVAAAERGHVEGWHIAYLLVVTALLVIAAGVLRRSWGLWFASVVQVLVVAAGVVTWPMYVVGLAFAAIWLYYLRLWRTTRGPGSQT
jgi:uncharacterized protein DUF4233